MEHELIAVLLTAGFVFGVLVGVCIGLVVDTILSRK